MLLAVVGRFRVLCAIVNAGTIYDISLKVYHIFSVAPLRLDLLPLALLAQVIMFDDRPLPEAT